MSDIQDLDQFITRVEAPFDHTLDEFIVTPLKRWEETVEGQLAEGAGFSQELCAKLRDLNEFSRTATKKQTRNYSKKIAKKMVGDRTAPKFTKTTRQVTVNFD